MLGDDSLTVMSDSVVTGSKTRFCPVCKAKGNTNKLRLYQINLTEAVLLCTGEKCTYPMGVEPSQSIIFSRDAASATFSKKCKLPASPSCAGRQVQSGKGQVTHCLQQQASSSSTFLNRLHLSNDTRLKGGLVSFKTSSNIGNKEKPTEANNKQKGFKSYLAEVGNNQSTLSTPRALDKLNVSKPIGESLKKHSVYPQWCCQGVNCWLNAVLNLLVHSSQLQQRTKINHTKSDLLVLIKKYNLAQMIYKQSASKLNGEKHSGLDKIRRILTDEPCSVIKHNIVHRDKNEDEAVSGLKSLLNSEPSIIQKCWMINTMVSTSCDHCNSQSSNRLEMPVLKFSKPYRNFSMSNIEEECRACDKCSSESVRARTSVSHYPLVLFAEFTHGLQGSSPADYDFQSPDGAIYRVKGIVQHRRKTNQYVTWIRDIESGMWMECDDQKDILSSFNSHDLAFLLSEVRLVMWEMKNSSGGQCPNGSFAGEPIGTKKLCSKPSEKRETVKCSTESEYVKCSSESPRQCIGVVQQEACVNIKRKNLEFVQSTTATVCESDKQSCTEKASGKTTYGGSPKSIGENLENMKNTSAKKGVSTETLRIQRMRERFLKDKQKLEDRRSTVHSEKCSSMNPIIPHSVATSTEHIVPSDLQKHGLSRHSTEPVHQCLQTGSAKTVDNKCAEHNAGGGSTKLQNTVLDRVLKYLPKGAVPKLPFMNIEQPSTLEKSKLKNKGKFSFEGYVPKSTITKRNCENREQSMSEKDSYNSRATSCSEKEVNVSEFLGKSNNHRINKLRLSVSPGRAGVKFMTDLSPLKRRLKSNTEESQGSLDTTENRMSTPVKRKLDISVSLPIKKRLVSIPGITSITSDHETVDLSLEYCSNNVASTANEMNYTCNAPDKAEKTRLVSIPCITSIASDHETVDLSQEYCSNSVTSTTNKMNYTQNAPDKAELLNTRNVSSGNGSAAFHSACGFNEMESTVFSQSMTVPDNDNSNMFVLGEYSMGVDFPVPNSFTVSPIKAPHHFSVTSWIQPTFTQHVTATERPDFTPAFASYPNCQSSPFVNMGHGSSELLLNPLLSHSPERTNMSLLMDGRTKVQWS